MLPDRSLLKEQHIVENAKIGSVKCDILSNFQTMCCGQTALPDNLSMNWHNIH